MYKNTSKTDVSFKISSPAYVGFRLQSNPPLVTQWELAYLCQWWIRSWVPLRVSRNSPKLLSTRPRSVLLWLYFSRLPSLCLKRRFSSLSLSLSFCTLVVLSFSHSYKSSSHRLEGIIERGVKKKQPLTRYVIMYHRFFYRAYTITRTDERTGGSVCVMMKIFFFVRLHNGDRVNKGASLFLRAIPIAIFLYFCLLSGFGWWGWIFDFSSWWQDGSLWHGMGRRVGTWSANVSR